MSNDIDSLISMLATAQRDLASSVDATPYSALDRDAAYRVQTGVLAALGETVGMLKTGLHSDGVGIVGPIYAGRVGRGSGVRLPAATATGVEVEVGVVLARDVPAGADEAAVRAAVGHYFLGAEVCGTRYRDRAAAQRNAGLADNVSAHSYVIGATRSAGDAIEGLPVTVSFDGAQVYAAPAKHGFGTVLASLVAYAQAPHPDYPLKSGTIVTTGSMCGLVAHTGPAHVRATLGDEAVEFDLA